MGLQAELGQIRGPYSVLIWHLNTEIPLQGFVPTVD